MGNAPFDLCSAQQQLRWYGLLSISVSCIDKLPSNAHRSITLAATVVIVLILPPPLSLSNVFVGLCVLFMSAHVIMNMLRLLHAFEGFI